MDKIVLYDTSKPFTASEVALHIYLLLLSIGVYDSMLLYMSSPGWMYSYAHRTAFTCSSMSIHSSQEYKTLKENTFCYSMEASFERLGMHKCINIWNTRSRL